MSTSAEQVARLVSLDGWLQPHQHTLEKRLRRRAEALATIERNDGSLRALALSYESYGLRRVAGGVSYREWAPGAASVAVIGEFNKWNKRANQCARDAYGVWTCFIADGADGSPAIAHDTRVKIALTGHDGTYFERLSTWSRFVRQEGERPEFNARFWAPPQPYEWRHSSPLDLPGGVRSALKIYESHVGMSSEDQRVASYDEFRENILPHVKATGYNCIQLMAVMEHSYYASFGYQVTSFFAPASRSGTPEQLKALIDRAHELGLLVLLDLVHSHASRNQLDGVSFFDGTDSHYFHAGGRGEHPMWDSRLFDYGNYETQRFLLSNVAFWLREFRFDGLRFDGVTSMIYLHRGLSQCDFFNEAEIDIDALTYLSLATQVAREVRPGAIVIAEEVSGWPALCRPHADGGIGFTHRLAMAIPDLWIKYLKHKRDEDWDMGEIVYELTNRPAGQLSVAYAESHDQALVGDKTLAFWLMDADMYTEMTVLKPPNERVRRGIALHKLIRLLTCALGGEAWLAFMGNEFGHPEWLDFPREGNNWSFLHCRRQWHLAHDPLLRYQHLLAFDHAMLALEERTGWLSSEQAFVSLKHQDDKMLSFDRPRGQLYFVVNLHAWKTFEDYPIGVDAAGRYRLMLDSEIVEFGGERAMPERPVVLDAQPTIPGQPHDQFKPFFIPVTLGPRSALVFERLLD